MKKKKLIIIALIIITLLLLTGLSVNATQIHYESEEHVLKTAEIDLTKEDLMGIYEPAGNAYTEKGGIILGIATYICYGAALIILLYKGVQFMNKAPEAKAEVKKELVSCAVGAFILFGIGTILKVISNILINEWF